MKCQVQVLFQDKKNLAFQENCLLQTLEGNAKSCFQEKIEEKVQNSVCQYLNSAGQG